LSLWFKNRRRRERGSTGAPREAPPPVFENAT